MATGESWSYTYNEGGGISFATNTETGATTGGYAGEYNSPGIPAAMGANPYNRVTDYQKWQDYEAEKSAVDRQRQDWYNREIAIREAEAQANTEAAANARQQQGVVRVVSIGGVPQISTFSAALGDRGGKGMILSQLAGRKGFYGEPGDELGDRLTAARQAMEPNKPTGTILLEQAAERRAIGDIKGARYYENEADKANKNLSEFEAAVHEYGMRADVPTGPNPGDYAGDLSRVFAEGTRATGRGQLANIDPGYNVFLSRLPDQEGFGSARWKDLRGDAVFNPDAWAPAMTEMYQSLGVRGAYVNAGRSASYIPGEQPYVWNLEEQQQIAAGKTLSPTDPFRVYVGEKGTPGSYWFDTNRVGIRHFEQEQAALVITPQAGIITPGSVDKAVQAGLLPAPFASIASSSVSVKGKEPFSFRAIPGIIGGNVREVFRLPVIDVSIPDVAADVRRVGGPVGSAGLTMFFPGWNVLGMYASLPGSGYRGEQPTVPDFNLDQRAANIKSQRTGLDALIVGNVTEGTWTGSQVGFNEYQAKLGTLNKDVDVYNRDVQKTVAAQNRVTEWEQTERFGEWSAWGAGAGKFTENLLSTTGPRERQLAFERIEKGNVVGWAGASAMQFVSRPSDLIVAFEQGVVVGPAFGEGMGGVGKSIAARYGPIAAARVETAANIGFAGTYLGMGGFVNPVTNEFGFPSSPKEYATNVMGTVPEFLAFSAGGYAVTKAPQIQERVEGFGRDFKESVWQFRHEFAGESTGASGIRFTGPASGGYESLGYSNVNPETLSLTPKGQMARRMEIWGDVTPEGVPFQPKPTGRKLFDTKADYSYLKPQREVGIPAMIESSRPYPKEFTPSWEAPNKITPEMPQFESAYYTRAPEGVPFQKWGLGHGESIGRAVRLPEASATDISTKTIRGRADIGKIMGVGLSVSVSVGGRGSSSSISERGGILPSLSEYSRALSEGRIGERWGTRRFTEPEIKGLVREYQQMGILVPREFLPTGSEIMPLRPLFVSEEMMDLRKLNAKYFDLQITAQRTRVTPRSFHSTAQQETERERDRVLTSFSAIFKSDRVLNVGRQSLSNLISGQYTGQTTRTMPMQQFGQQQTQRQGQLYTRVPTIVPDQPRPPAERRQPTQPPFEPPPGFLIPWLPMGGGGGGGYGRRGVISWTESNPVGAELLRASALGGRGFRMPRFRMPRFRPFG